MKNHTKVYLNKMGYSEGCFIPCEVCQLQATDVHHISARGGGGVGSNRIRGTKKTDKDYIQTLVGLCRTCHTLCESDKEFNNKVKELHLKILLVNDIN